MATDQYTPDRVQRLLSLHARRLNKRSNVWRMLNAAYLTRFWEYVGNARGQDKNSRWNINGTEIEVNRLWRRVMTYKAALYRKTSRIECGPDPLDDRGDPVIGSAVSNALWMDESSAEQMDRAVEMGILFPGAGFKVGVDEGRAPALRRVWTRVIPWWEMVLDSDVSDVKDERFRGHRYWAPKAQIEDKYNLVGLTGSQRKDFLFEDNSEVDRPLANSTGENSGDDDGEFVEVLEFSNLVDWVRGSSGGKYKGRQEIYILNQGDKYKDPIDRSPLPFADADGVGMSHIEYLIFCHEPSFPLRGVSPCERILPQLRETNVYRTKLAEMLRRNARKLFYRKGALPDDQLDKLIDGNDYVFPAIEDESVDMRAIVYPVPSIPISAEFWQWMGQVQADDDQAWGQITPATGGASERNKTAYANQIEQFWTESEIGYHGQCLTSTVKRLTRLRLRAVIHAMQSAGDAVGGHGAAPNGALPADTDLAPIGATRGEDSAPTVALTDAEQGAAGPAVSVNEASEVSVATGDADKSTTSQSGDVAKVVVNEFTVKDLDGNLHQVTVKALDGDFEIKFVDGGRTPMADSALLQFLSTQGKQYFEWFAMVVKGGPGAVIARAWMQEVAAIAQLPPALHVDTLERKAEEEGKAPKGAAPSADLPPGAEEGPPPEPEQAQPEQTAPEGAPQRGDPLSMALAEIANSLQEAAKAAPEAASVIQASLQALQGAAAAKEKGDVTGVVEALTAAMDALEPLAQNMPEAATPAIAHAVEVMDQVRRALMKGAPPAASPAEAPPAEEGGPVDAG